MNTEKEFDDTHLRMIRAACQHTEGKVSSAVVLQLFNEIDELRAALKECRNATLEESAVNRDAAVKRAYAEGYERRDMEIKAAFT